MFNLFGYHMDILTIAKRSFVLRSKAFRFRYVPVLYKRVLYCTRKKLGFGFRVFSTVGSSYCSYGDISSLEALFNIAYIHPRSATARTKRSADSRSSLFSPRCIGVLNSNIFVRKWIFRRKIFFSHSPPTLATIIFRGN